MSILTTNYHRLIRTAHRVPGLTRLARRAALLVPDLPVTRNVPQLGKFSFGLRRHRWMISNECFRGHAAMFCSFRRWIDVDDVVYDIGANIGYYTRWIMAHCAPKRLIAIEPMAANIRLLNRNVRLGGHEDSVTILPIAISDSAGLQELQVDDVSDGSAVLAKVSAGLASTGRRALGLRPKSELVKTMQLDEVISTYQLPRPTVIKIDTEGAEVLVLQGATEILVSDRPRLMIALHGQLRAEQVVRHLTDLNYVCYRQVLELGEYRLREVKPADAAQLQDNNIVCIPDSDGREAKQGGSIEC